MIKSSSRTVENAGGINKKRLAGEMCWSHNMNKGFSRLKPYKKEAVGKQGYSVTASRHKTQKWLVSEKEVESIKLIFLKVALFFHGMDP